MFRYIFVIMMIPSLLHAGVLTLQDAISIGLKNSFDVKSVKLAGNISEQEITVQESKFDPAVSASVNGRFTDTPNSYAPYNVDYLRENTYTGQAALTKLHESGFKGEFALKTSRRDTNNPNEELDPVYKTVLMMNITVPVLRNFGKDINLTGVKSAGISRKQAELELYNLMIAKAAEIEASYRKLTRAKEVLELARQSEELAMSLLKYDTHRFNAGIAPITEVQEAETAVAARQEQTVVAETAVRSVINELENLLNNDVELTEPETEPLVNTWSEFALDSVYDTALKVRPDLAEKRLELEKMNLRIKYLKNQELPELDVVNTLGLIGISGNERSDSAFSGNYPESIYDTADADGYEVYVGLNFRYPLGAKGAKAQTSKAASEKMQAVYSLKKLEKDTRKELKDALTVISGSKERYQISQTSIELAERTLTQEMKKMKEGLSDTFRILKFQSDVIEAKTRAINALYDYNRGLTMLYRADGTNLDRYGFKIGE